MSSVSEDDDEVPLINTDTSKGSSVSSGMQEEYNELLKYAIVTPKWEPQICVELPNVLPELRLQEPDNVPLTTVDAYSELEESSYSSNDGHDSAMGSDELTSGRRTARDIATDANGENMRQTMQSSVPTGPILSSTAASHNQTKRQEERVQQDHDIQRMNHQLNQWNARFNNMVLTELSQTKMGMDERYRRMLHAKEKEHQAEMKKLQDEMENMKELLHTYENSLARKDAVISNLTRALQTSKEKQEMAKALALWKFRLSDEKREAFTTHLARRHRQHTLSLRAWQAWRSTIEGSWRGKVENACQKKAQEVCVQLTNDYETKLSSLNQALEDSKAEVQSLQNDRERYEDTMKKAFMRGVCALNLEAMTMFNGEEQQDTAGIQTLSAAVDALSCASFPPDPSYGQQHPPPPPRTQSHPEFSKAPPSTIPYCFREYNQVPSNIKHSQSVPSQPVPGQRGEVPQPQVASNPTQLPQVPTKMQKKLKNPKALNVKVTASGNKGCKAKNVPLSSLPPSVLVKRHHPNMQNLVTQQPLKHMTKYPNTPAKPIAGQQ